VSRTTDWTSQWSRRHLADHQHQAGGGGHLTPSATAVARQDIAEDRVSDLVAELVGVTWSPTRR
jgi:hypothetical protein